MVSVLEAIVGAVLATLRPRASLVLENLALRQQLSILRRSTPRPRLRPLDRAFWVVLSRTWSPLGRRPGNREARDGDCLASPGLRSILGEQVLGQLDELGPYWSPRTPTEQQRADER